MKTIQFNSDVIYGNQSEPDALNKMAGDLDSNGNAEETEIRGAHIRERFMENDEVIGIIKRVQDICKDWMSLEADLEMMTSKLIFSYFSKNKTKGLKFA